MEFSEPCCSDAEAVCIQMLFRRCDIVSYGCFQELYLVSVLLLLYRPWSYQSDLWTFWPALLALKQTSALFLLLLLLLHPFIHLLYLLGGNPGSLPPWPPALHHGDETREHDAGGEDAKNAGEAVDVQGVAVLSLLDRAVEVTGAVLGPPFQFEYIHVPVLLELQDSRRQRDTNVHADINIRKYDSLW